MKAIATLYAQEYPNQIRSLALIGSPLGIINWANPVRNSILNGVNPFIPITKEQFDLEISLLFVTPPSIPDAVKAEKVRDYRTHNGHYQPVWDIVNLYEDILCQNGSLQRPTLAIWGKQDQIYEIRGAERLQSCLPGSKMIQLPKAGHLLLMEDAAEAALEYVRFLQTIRSGSLDHESDNRDRINNGIVFCDAQVAWRLLSVAENGCCAKAKGLSRR